MTQREFEERTGRKVEAEEYDRANQMYMTTLVGKDQFCKEWETIKGSRVLADLAMAVDDYRYSYIKEQKMKADAEKKAEELQNEYNQLQESYDDLCDHAKDLADKVATKETIARALEKEVSHLEAEKSTLYKLLEKLLDKREQKR